MTHSLSTSFQRNRRGDFQSLTEVRDPDIDRGSEDVVFVDEASQVPMFEQKQLTISSTDSLPTTLLRRSKSSR